MERLRLGSYCGRMGRHGGDRPSPRARAGQAPEGTTAPAKPAAAASPAAIAARAVELQKQGKLEDAAAEYRRFLELSPKSWEARSNLGVVYAQLGRFDDAVVAVPRGARAAPVGGRRALQPRGRPLQGGADRRGGHGARGGAEGAARPPRGAAAPRRLPPAARGVEEGDRDPRPAPREGPREPGHPVHDRDRPHARPADRARPAGPRPDPAAGRLGARRTSSSRSRAARRPTTSPRRRSCAGPWSSTRGCRPRTPSWARCW